MFWAWSSRALWQQEGYGCSPKQPAVEMRGMGEETVNCERYLLSFPASPQHSTPSSCKHITMSEEPRPSPVLVPPPPGTSPLFAPSPAHQPSRAESCSRPQSVLPSSPRCRISSSTDSNSFHPKTKKRRDSPPCLRPAHLHATVPDKTNASSVCSGSCNLIKPLLLTQAASPPSEASEPQGPPAPPTPGVCGCGDTITG